MKITRPNQVWAADITYIPMARGFLYLVAIIDWYSYPVLRMGPTTVSHPFDLPKTGKIATKVINHYGDEVLKVYEVK